jgi:hypothetical protein
MGARRLMEWIRLPLLDVDQIGTQRRVTIDIFPSFGQSIFFFDSCMMIGWNAAADAVCQ